ncbi:MAG: hypothetical protein HYV08_17070 [Deltaproteobacteria bacterium]|nr:hypothetical protein [Deltaproteobacteria bacterium]MBI3078111.1 hypothetical protein [Deltaproteobacteria bacterium]
MVAWTRWVSPMLPVLLELGRVVVGLKGSGASPEVARAAEEVYRLVDGLRSALEQAGKGMEALQQEMQQLLAAQQALERRIRRLERWGVGLAGLLALLLLSLVLSRFP